MFTMRRAFVAAAFVLSTASIARAQATIAGDWEGVLKAAIELRLALHVVEDGDGRLKATLDNIDQGGFRIPVTSIALAGPQLTLRIDALGSSYEGTVSADGTTAASARSRSRRTARSSATFSSS